MFADSSLPQPNQPNILDEVPTPVALLPNPVSQDKIPLMRMRIGSSMGAGGEGEMIPTAQKRISSSAGKVAIPVKRMAAASSMGARPDTIPVPRMPVASSMGGARPDTLPVPQISRMPVASSMGARPDTLPAPQVPRMPVASSMGVFAMGARLSASEGERVPAPVSMYSNIDDDIDACSECYSRMSMHARTHCGLSKMSFSERGFNPGEVMCDFCQKKIV
jgi:hypothetical protein